MSATETDLMLRAAEEAGTLSNLDVQFASRLSGLYEESRAGVVWAIALAWVASRSHRTASM